MRWPRLRRESRPQCALGMLEALVLAVLAAVEEHRPRARALEQRKVAEERLGERDRGRRRVRALQLLADHAAQHRAHVAPARGIAQRAPVVGTGERAHQVPEVLAVGVGLHELLVFHHRRRHEEDRVDRLSFAVERRQRSAGVEARTEQHEARLAQVLAQMAQHRQRIVAVGAIGIHLHRFAFALADAVIVEAEGRKTLRRQAPRAFDPHPVAMRARQREPHDAASRGRRVGCGGRVDAEQVTVRGRDDHRPLGARALQLGGGLTPGHRATPW